MVKVPTPQAASWIQLVQQQRAIAVIRSPDFSQAQQMATAIAAGGMKLIEITWDCDRPAQLIEHLQSQLPDCTIGTGTILTVGQLRSAIAAGAKFIFTPHTNPTLIDLAQAHAVPIIPGALTPTEIVTAWQAGASSVKVFPIQALGGASYLSSLRDPLSQIPLIPTGGVTLDNAADLIAAGAIAVGLAGHLFPKAALQQGNWALIQRNTQTLLHHLRSLTLPGGS